MSRGWGPAARGEPTKPDLRGEQLDAVTPGAIPAVEARRLDDPSPRLGVQLAVVPLIDQQELLCAPEVEGRRDRAHHHGTVYCNGDADMVCASTCASRSACAARHGSAVPIYGNESTTAR